MDKPFPAGMSSLLTRLTSWISLRRRPARPSLMAGTVSLRVGAEMWAEVRRHVEDFSRGEEAGFLVYSQATHSEGRVLVAREWHPVPEDCARRGEGYVVSWSADFSATMVERAAAINGGLILIHSHGGDPAPDFSWPDLRSARQLFPSLSRLLDVPCGTVVLGDQTASGLFWADGQELRERFGEVLVARAPIERWRPRRTEPAPPRRRADRQTRALGSASEASLAAATVAVIGCSGGGSHICQQLAHLGVGTVMPLDDELVDEVNLGRMVGSEPADIGIEKVQIMKRLAGRIDPTLRILPVRARFPSAEAIDGLKRADIIVSAVDSLLAREQINLFCRRYLVPLVDIGIGIETKDERLLSADGQVVCVLPDSACVRCTPLLSDAALERERRERPPGYDRNPLAGDPQVVSMNGTLASEACNVILDLLCGYARGRRGAGWWQYDGRRGELYHDALPAPWDGCPACAEAGHADPPTG